MLSAAARTCVPGADDTSDHHRLLRLVRWATDVRDVAGQSFAEFLALAQNRVDDLAAGSLHDSAGLSNSLTDIRSSCAADLIGNTYAELVDLVSHAYEETGGGEGIEAPLEQEAIRGGSDRTYFVAGAVPSSRHKVLLTLYSDYFDLKSLAMVPYILAHELVCHVAAHGIRASAPKREVRDFFGEGFMDQATWYLARRWVFNGVFPSMTPAGQLSAEEVPYAHMRPVAFAAGRGAWMNCIDHVAREAPGGSAPDAVLRGALLLNALACDVSVKDCFVQRAQSNDTATLARFVEIAVDGKPPQHAFGL